MHPKISSYTTLAFASALLLGACNKAPTAPPAPASQPTVALPQIVTPAPATAPVAATPAPVMAAGGGASVRQACAEDMRKFCPQGGKPGPCLRGHRAELSEQCKAARAARKAERAGKAGRVGKAGRAAQ